MVYNILKRYKYTEKHLKMFYLFNIPNLSSVRAHGHYRV